MTLEENQLTNKIGVIGLGTMGSFAFWQLAKLGYDVTGFEQFTPGHKHGAGHGETRIFRTAYGEGIKYVPLLKESRKLWRELEKESGKNLYTETGGVMFGLPDDVFIETVQASVDQFHLPHEKWTSTDANKAFPQINFSENQVAIFEQFAGFIQAEKAIQTAIDQGIANGGQAILQTEVKAIIPNDAGVTVITDDNKYRFDRIIVAVGGWTNSLLPELNLPTTIERQVLVWYQAKNPELFSSERFPIFSRMKDGIGFYGFPTVDGKTVKVAFHHGGKLVNHPDEVDRHIHESDLSSLNELVSVYLQDLIPNPVRAETCFYTNTPDEHFIVGHHKKVPNTILLGPMAGHGFKFAPILGRIAAEKTVNQKLTLAIDMFDPNRF